jgi:hypothetical protein
MSKSRQSNQAAKALVSPFFAWTNAVLKGGEMVLDSMQAAAKNARSVRVAVLPDKPKSRPSKTRRARRRR